MTIIPRWEWRTFSDDFGPAEAYFASYTPDRVVESEEVYLLARDSDASAKVRDGVMDVKALQHRTDDGLEQWLPVMKAEFPLAAADVVAMAKVLGAEFVPDKERYTVEEVTGAHGEVVGMPVHKRRSRYTVGGCMAELTTMTLQGQSVRTVAVEDPDPDKVRAAVEELGLQDRPVTCVARGLKTVAGIEAHRYAVIDVGTNSVKFHVGEQTADRTWHTVVDRAAVTRLGQGLDGAGTLQPDAMARTAEAIAAMAQEAERLGVEGLAAVGTAGLRMAPNGPDFVAQVRAACGVEVEIIPGDEEARLAYVATVSALGIAVAALTVFDTGGGSSQFTFGDGANVEEQFSVNVGAARFTERFGLDGPVDEATIAEAREAIRADFSRLADRPTPDAIVGMGGAVTNLAAVKHELPEYDASVIQGAELTLGDIDAQIARYRSLTADERAGITGLQPNRAEVILAGACIVRTVVELLGRDTFTVSDRGLRHGLIVERFGLPPM